MTIVTRGLGGRGFIVTRGLGDNGVRPAIIVTITELIGIYSLIKTLIGEYDLDTEISARSLIRNRVRGNYSLVETFLGRYETVETFLGDRDLITDIKVDDMLIDQSVALAGGRKEIIYITGIRSEEDLAQTIKDDTIVTLVGRKRIDINISGEAEEQ